MRQRIENDLFFDISKITAWFITEYGLEYLIGEKWFFLGKEEGNGKWAKSFEIALREADEVEQR